MEDEDFNCPEHGCDVTCRKRGYLKLHLMKLHGHTAILAEQETKNVELDLEKVAEQRAVEVPAPVISKMPGKPVTVHAKSFADSLDYQLQLHEKLLVLAQYKALIRDCSAPVVPGTSPDVTKMLQTVLAFVENKQVQDADVEISRIQAEPEEKPSDLVGSIMNAVMQDPQKIIDLALKYVPQLGNLLNPGGKE